MQCLSLRSFLISGLLGFALASAALVNAGDAIFVRGAVNYYGQVNLPSGTSVSLGTMQQQFYSMGMMAGDIAVYDVSRSQYLRISGASLSGLTSSVFSNHHVYKPDSSGFVSIDPRQLGDEALIYVSYLDGSDLDYALTTQPFTVSGSSSSSPEIPKDTVAPILYLPSQLVVSTPHAAGAGVLYEVKAKDETDTNVSVSCKPLSGALFVPGKTTVTCVARDDAQNITKGSFSIVVKAGRTRVADNQPPLLIVPQDITVAVQTSRQRAVKVTFSVSARDDAGRMAAVKCTKKSGDQFPLGKTTVRCTAVDSARNSVTTTFNVSVMRKAP